MLRTDAQRCIYTPCGYIQRNLTLLFKLILLLSSIFPVGRCDTLFCISSSAGCTKQNSTVLLRERERERERGREREGGFEYVETTEIILFISVSNYIVTTSLLDRWPKIDERISLI